MSKAFLEGYMDKRADGYGSYPHPSSPAVGDWSDTPPDNKSNFRKQELKRVIRAYKHSGDPQISEKDPIRFKRHNKDFSGDPDRGEQFLKYRRDKNPLPEEEDPYDMYSKENPKAVNDEERNLKRFLDHYSILRNDYTPEETFNMMKNKDSYPFHHEPSQKDIRKIKDLINRGVIQAGTSVTGNAGNKA